MNVLQFWSEKMAWQHTPFTIPLLIGALLAALQALSVWRRRTTVGWKPLTLLLIVVSFWSLTYAAEIATATLPAKLFWARIEYFAIVFVPLAWFAFLLVYSEQGHVLTRPLIALLLIVPMITLAAVWTNPAHALYWSRSTLDGSRGFTLVVNEYGPLFWLWIGYAYLVFVASTVVMVRLALRSPQITATETAVLLIGASLPWFSNLVSVTSLNPFPGLDMTPFALLLSGSILTSSFFEQRLLDVRPVVREMLYDHLRDGILVLDRSEQIVVTNRAAQRLLRRDAPDLIGYSIDAVLPQWPLLTANLSADVDATLEMVLPGKTAPLYLELQLVPLRDRRNRLTGRTVTLRDIGARKSNEAQLRYQATLMQHITDAVITVREERITGWNQAAESLYGWRMDEVIGRNVHGLLNMHAAPAEPVKSVAVPEPVEASQIDVLSAARETGHWHGELMHHHRSGMPLYVSSSISTLHHEEPAGHAGESGLASQLIVNRDITQLKLTEQTLRETQKLESISLLADGVAGDFNELLDGIMAQTSLALSALPPDSKASQHIRKVATSAQRAVDITRQLLAYAGKGYGEPEPLEVNELLGGNMRQFEAGLSHQTSLYVDLCSQSTLVWGNRTQLEQVIENLLSNATESIPPSGGRVVVRTFVEDLTAERIAHFRYRDQLQPGCYVGLEVSDTGVGMGVAVQERMFDPFYTTKPAGQGLGLSATLGIIRAHGGGLHVRSEPGQGTQCIILLPLHE